MKPRKCPIPTGPKLALHSGISTLALRATNNHEQAGPAEEQRK